MSRRTLIRSGLLFGLGGGVPGLAACVTEGSAPTGGPAPSAAATSAVVSPESTATGGAQPVSGRILLAYFSRAGENYYYGGRRNLEVGNTQVLADLIAGLIDCDAFRIEATDAYPDSYDATVARNVEEQNDDARPGFAYPPEDIDGYDTVLLGSPIWNVRPPMIMSTFAERYDFTDKQILPFVTYAVSGLGNTAGVYAAAFPDSRLEDGLAVQGEEVARNRNDVEAWLRKGRLID